MIRLTPHQTRLLRSRAQRLFSSEPAERISPPRLLNEVFGVQAQDLPAALLSVRARSAGLTAAQVEAARQAGAIAWIWCMRGTLHLVDAADARWLVPFLGPKFGPADQRRFRQLGWNEDAATAGIRLLKDALAERGGLTRPEIVSLLQANKLPFEGQAPIHLLYRAALEGWLCSGPDREGTPTYVLFDQWLGQQQFLPRQEALAKMVCRYLEAYAPAGPEDMASWSGLKLGEAREAWKLIADRAVEVEAAGRQAWMLKTQLPWLEGTFETEPQVRLLPRFDTYLLGYTDRDLVVDAAYARRIHPGGGIINPALLVDGRVQGTWRVKRRKKTLEVSVEAFEGLADSLLPFIEAEVADLGRYLGEESVLSLISTPLDGT